MSTSIQTSQEVADAKSRFTHAKEALGKLLDDLLNGDRKTIASARRREDDTRGEANEARAELEQAEIRHQAAVKAEKRTRYAAARAGHAEGRKLLDAEFTKIRRLRTQLVETCSRVDTILKTNSEQCGLANGLGQELGEAADLTPISDVGAHALALRALSGTDGAGYNTQVLAVWLRACPTQADADIEICASFDPSTPWPPNLTAREAADLYLASFDVSAPRAESQRRTEQKFGRLRRAEEEEVERHREAAKKGLRAVLDMATERDRRNMEAWQTQIQEAPVGKEHMSVLRLGQ
jgi:hypothetical protein